MVALDEIEKDRRRDATQAHVERLERLIDEVRDVMRRPGSGEEKIAFLREVLGVAGYPV